MTSEQRAMWIAALAAVDPAGLGGVCLRSPPQPLRDQWLKILRGLLPAAAPFRRMPHAISDRQLFGGLDLSATLKSGSPVAESGILAAVHGGMLVIAMAERLSTRTASCLNAAMDRGAVCVPREGVWLEHAAQFGIIALDEGIAADEGIPPSLFERLAFLLELSALNPRTVFAPLHDSDEIDAARRRMQKIRISTSIVRTIIAVSQSLGAGSARSALLTARAARIIAALDESSRIREQDLMLAVNLVLAPRATQLPSTDGAAPESPEREPQPPGADSDSASTAGSDQAGGKMEERLIAASEAAVPKDLLAKLKVGHTPAGRRHTGRSGAAQYSLARGRPAGVRAGNPQRDGRLNVISTLQAAAPWQRLRTQSRPGTRIRIEASDFRITRYRQRTRTLIVFAVDASGSAALHRLAEAKGAVELILADCYVRRDQVAVIGFRGQAAQVLLPPTRSLVRAKSSLAGLPGGGATPLASGLEAALDMALKAQRRGDTPSIVLLTDGRANVGFNGVVGRDAGHRDALRAAAAIRLAKLAVLFIDTSPRPSPAAREVASSMLARYVPLPWSDPKRILEIVKSQSLGRQSVGA